MAQHDDASASIEHRPPKSSSDLEIALREKSIAEGVWLIAEKNYGRAFARGVRVAFDRAGSARIEHRDSVARGQLTALRVLVAPVLAAAPPGKRGRTVRSALAELAPAAPRSATERDGPVTLVGFALRFEERSVDLGGFFEYIDRGAVLADLKRGRDVRALDAHDPQRLLGRTSTKTLRLAVDQRGLGVEIDLPGTSVAADLLALVRRGDVAGMSFAMTVLSDEWTRGATLLERLVTGLVIHEVSATPTPAYPSTSIKVRSALEGMQADLDAKLARWRTTR